MMRYYIFSKIAKEKSTHKERGGFSLIELIIVLAIMTVLSAVGFVSLSEFRGRENLKKTTDELVAVIEATQKRSISQDAGNRWNVRFSNSTSSGSQYIVFSSSSYSAGVVDRTYGLSRGMLFSEPSSGNVFDALFAPITGTLPARKIISLVTGRGDGLVGDIIMNTAGLVTTRAESGLVGYWHFDENTSTTAFDASGMGNNGTLTNSPTWQTGTSCTAGSCLVFSGTGKYVSIPYQASLKLGSASTISLWFYPNSLATGTHELISYGGSSYATGYLLSQYGSNLYVYWMSGGTIATLNNLFSTGSWHHIAVVNNAGVFSFYKNGALIGTSTASVPIANNFATYIGGDPTNAAWTPDGTLDEVRIYNRALSATEIANMYSDLK